MNTIKLSDLQILSNYRFIDGKNKINNNLLGLKWIKQGSEWTQQLVEVDRKETKCWSAALSQFGIGSLKYTTVSLDEVCAYLSQYQWKEIKAEMAEDPEESMHSAFYTVCGLANRQIVHGRFQLFKQVSDQVQSEFNHYWNPAMNERFLRKLQEYRIPEVRGLQLRFKDFKDPVQRDDQPCLNPNEIANIEVGYDYQLVEKEVDYSDSSDDDEWTEIYRDYHYPSDPYFSTNPVKESKRNTLHNNLENSASGPKSNDVGVLSDYRFVEWGSNQLNEHLLGLKWIKRDSGWTQELVKINRKELTCWSLFLSGIGLGSLKHITFSLDKICDYLSRYQWKEIKMDINDNPFSINHSIFHTICHLANRQLYRKSGNIEPQLFKQVSDCVSDEFNHYWNPAMYGRFLLNQHRYRLINAKGVEIRFKDSKIPVPPYQKLTEDDLDNIEAGYAYEHRHKKKHGDDVIIYSNYYYYPNPPYYATKFHTTNKPAQREI